MPPENKLTEGREKLLAVDETIVLPEKQKGLTFDSASDRVDYGQHDIDDILKGFDPKS